MAGRRPRVRFAFAAVALALAVAADLHAQRAASGPASSMPAPSTSSGQAGPAASRPAEHAPVPAANFRDDWLSQIALDELARAAAKGEFAELGETVRSACLARLCAGRVDQLQAVNDLWFVCRACRHLDTAQQLPDGAAMVKMLLADHDLARLLIRAVDGSPDPAKAMQTFHALWKAEPKLVQEYANLAVAFAVASPPKSKDANVATLEESFRFYTDKRNAFHYDLRAMPFELSVFLADTRLSLGERMWARKMYSGPGEPGGKAYFDLRDDYDYYRDGKAKKIDALAYTLPNLRQVGGVCIDQAYYAAQVCKAVGIPAAIDVGTGSSGMGHAWLASLKLSRDGREALWDLETGRYEALRFYVGEVRDPVTARAMPDCELALIGAASRLPLVRREEADTAADLAQIVGRQFDAPPEANRAGLRALAQAYNTKFGKAGGTTVNVDKEMPAARKLDAALAEDILAQSLERNLGYRPAWDLLVTLRGGNQIPVEHLDRFFEALLDRTAKDYPDFSCSLILRIVPTIPDGAARLKVYQKTATLYPRRPDLQGQILIAAGDEFKSQNNKEKALAAYQQAAFQCVDLATVVVKAAEQAEKLLLEAGKRDLAIVLYDKLFSASKKPRDTAFGSSTAWYKLGQHLASLLRDAGKEAQAQAITKRIEGK